MACGMLSFGIMKRRTRDDASTDRPIVSSVEPSIGFRDRADAGRRLAAELRAFAADAPLILALPRGGVPVGYEVARALSAPLDVWVVRKIGVPWHPELGVGAVAEGGDVQLMREILAHVGLSDAELSAAIEQKRREVEARVRRFRGDRPPPELRDRTVILVDDGIATGGTTRAAIRAIRARAPRKIVLAVPVASPDVLEALAPEVDRIVCLLERRDLFAIGLWYRDFTQVSDDEVVALLDRARNELAGASHVVA
jgi:putative phosphoribosyl transferase